MSRTSFALLFLTASASLAGFLALHMRPADIPALQAAFDREASVAGSDHDKDLQIVGMDCKPNAESKLSCQIGFIKRNEGGDRVYLDAALFERRMTGEWKLLRGLCRRLL